VIKRIRTTRHYQRADDQMRALATQSRPPIKKALREALDWLRKSVDVVKIKHALEHGDDPANTIDWYHFGEIIKAASTRLAVVHNSAGIFGAAQINTAFNRAGRTVRFRKDVAKEFNFDTLSPRTQQKLRDAQDELIQELSDGARDAIEQIIISGAQNGEDVASMADDIRSFISLTETQAQAAINYQAMLYDLDPQALQRQLRNSDYDQQLQDAIDSGEDLDDAVVGVMVDDYVDNFLDYRAAMIARTESTNAANRGLHDAYSQAVDRGVFPEEAVKRFWQLADHPCPVCESIPDNNPDGVGVNEDFDSIDGPIDDPAVHPNCECSVEYVTDLTLVPDEEEDEAA
jgi:hypothetical protein